MYFPPLFLLNDVMALKTQAELYTHLHMLNKVTGQLDELDAKRKLLLIKKKYLETVLSTTMDSHSLGEVNTSFGLVKYRQQKVTNPINNKQLDEALSEFYMNDRETAARLKSCIHKKRRVRVINHVRMPSSCTSKRVKTHRA